MSDFTLDLHDIQGNIVKGYGRYGYPKARYVFYTIKEQSKARKFISELLELTTTSVAWGQSGPDHSAPVEKPPATTNIAFTFAGLKAIGVPQKSLQSFPTAFAMGMPARKDLLRDDGKSAPLYWDPVWRSDKPVHMWLSINAQNEDALCERYKTICTLLAHSEGGIEQLHGHKGQDNKLLAYQDASARYIDGKPSPKEHFGYVDGISEPFFKGTGAPAEKALGAGKLTGEDPATLAGWQPLETGEFILGHPDEASEYPKAPLPPLLSKNGTFMVYRKLHQNVTAFKQYLEQVGPDFPGGKEALAAKFAGRWRNGAPVTTFATEQEANEYINQLQQAKKAAENTDDKIAQERYLILKQKLVAFNYDDDLSGSRCPVGAHLRRANPRGSLEFGEKDAYNTPGALVNRRRILRRGLPYGEVKDPAQDEGEHGIIFMALNADIERQFEFVQQQWMIYGNDFKLSNDKDVILGNVAKDDGRMMIEGDSNTPPFFCAQIPRMVETRGGDYFFIPSVTALRMLAEGIIDPT